MLVTRKVRMLPPLQHLIILGFNHVHPKKQTTVWCFTTSMHTAMAPRGSWWTATDVLVLVVTAISMYDCKLWLAFGYGAHFWYIKAYVIANDYCWDLPFIHAISGCDTVSSLNSVGKKAAWEVWKSLKYFNGCLLFPMKLQKLTWRNMKDMWFCCTLAHQNSLMWMKPRSISSIVIESWRTSHRDVQHFYM
jgi:hypothetical protein